MANCYRCGRYIEPAKFQLRRKVRTGEWLRRTYAKDRVTGVTQRFGMRVVCGYCASRIDREALRAEILQQWEFAAALLVLFALLLSRMLR